MSSARQSVRLPGSLGLDFSKHEVLQAHVNPAADPGAFPRSLWTMLSSDELSRLRSSEVGFI